MRPNPIQSMCWRFSQPVQFTPLAAVCIEQFDSRLTHAALRTDIHEIASTPTSQSYN